MSGGMRECGGGGGGGEESDCRLEVIIRRGEIGKEEE